MSHGDQVKICETLARACKPDPVVQSTPRPVARGGQLLTGPVCLPAAAVDEAHLVTSCVGAFQHQNRVSLDLWQTIIHPLAIIGTDSLSGKLHSYWPGQHSISDGA